MTAVSPHQRDGHRRDHGRAAGDLDRHQEEGAGRRPHRPRDTVCHFSPGTSKWNKIKHGLFSFISENWRGRPLISYEVIINLIAATTTTTGLKIYARLDKDEYPDKIEITDQQIAAVNLHRLHFHGEWNYTIKPSHK